MTTAGDLITEISSELHGYGSTQDRVTPLTANISATDSKITVDFAFGQSVGITPGIVEIDSEQLYVTNVDATTGICTLANGFGRGYRGTTATSHVAGAPVISRPKFPRKDLLQQMNEVVGSLFPDLYAVNTYTGVVQYPSNTYTLPSIPQFVIDAQWQDPIGNWQRLNSYTVDPFDGTFRLGSGGMIGRPLRLVYASEPVPFTSENDNFSVTGLPASCSDLLTLGVVAKTVLGLDISRAQTTSVEQQARSTAVPPFAGEKASQYAMALFQNRLQNEAASLRKRYRARLVRTF